MKLGKLILHRNIWVNLKALWGTKTAFKFSIIKLSLILGRRNNILSHFQLHNAIYSASKRAYPNFNFFFLFCKFSISNLILSIATVSSWVLVLVNLLWKLKNSSTPNGVSLYPLDVNSTNLFLLKMVNAVVVAWKEFVGSPFSVRL